MISLDMSKAFDSIKRTVVQAAIRDLQLPQDIESLRLMWMQGGTYAIEHRRIKCQIEARKGIKQGSTDAPLI